MYRNNRAHSAASTVLLAQELTVLIYPLWHLPPPTTALRAADTAHSQSPEATDPLDLSTPTCVETFRTPRAPVCPIATCTCSHAPWVAKSLPYFYDFLIHTLCIEDMFIFCFQSNEPAGVPHQLKLRECFQWSRLDRCRRLAGKYLLYFWLDHTCLKVHLLYVLSQYWTGSTSGNKAFYEDLVDSCSANKVSCGVYTSSSQWSSLFGSSSYSYGSSKCILLSWSY